MNERNRTTLHVQNKRPKQNKPQISGHEKLLTDHIGKLVAVDCTTFEGAGVLLAVDKYTITVEAPRTVQYPKSEDETIRFDVTKSIIFKSSILSISL